MKVISIKQPWASLVVLKLKGNETRSWPTKYRGQLAIHASKVIVPFNKLFLDATEMQRDLIMNDISEKYGSYNDLPTGQIIATCNMVDCQKVCMAFSDERDSINEVILENKKHVTGLELHLGDYSLDRFIWQLEDVVEFPEPIPAKGQLGLWKFDLEAIP